MNKLVAINLLTLLSLSSFALDFKTDQLHSKYGFKIKHLSITDVEGQFKGHSTYWTINDDGVIESFEAEVDAKTIDTDNEKRDKHLRNNDFFAVDKHPTIKFKMEKHVGTKLVGQMTMRGVTKRVIFDVKVSDVIKNPFNNNPDSKKMGIQLKAIIDRKDFNVGKGYKNITLSDKVEIVINLQGDSYVKK